MTDGIYNDRWFGFRLRGCGLLNINTSITDAGYGGCAGVELDRGFFDRYYSLILEYSRIVTTPKMAPPGSTPNGSNLFAIGIGKSTRSVISQNNGHRTGAVVTSSEVKIGGGEQELGGGTQRVGGQNYPLGSNSWGAFYISSAWRAGYELYVGERFVLQPTIGLSTSVTYPFADLSQRGQWRGSGRGISLQLGLNVGMADDSKIPVVGRPPNRFDTAHEFATDLLGDTQQVLSHVLYDAPIKAGNDLLDRTGFGQRGNLQQTEDIRFLQGADFMSGVFKVPGSISYYYAAHQSGQQNTATLKIVSTGLRGLGFMIGGLATGGEGLATHGFARAHEAVGMGLTHLDIDRRWLPAIMWLEGTAIGLIGGAVGSPGTARGGMLGASVAVASPDLTDSGVAESTTIKYTPRTFGSGEPSGAIAVQKRLRGGLYTEVEGSSHVLTGANLGTRVVNVTGSTNRYEGVGADTAIRNTIGYMHRFGSPSVALVLGAGAFSSINFGNGTRAGIGAKAEGGIEFEISKRVSLRLGGEYAVEQIIGGNFSHSGGPSTGFTIRSKKKRRN